ncbi:HNH endonuclease signature motif containing protein [Kineothrix sp. MB12-C1]|uniref:HNH endonuclease signature motif containing protein n=1 Tax=Kineothrix sp. MB12-C1 TaxID=3070215 RepID=UPI0027D24455|nr:HNH endonuclease domain-containing protein [Kineothrix sp. MB12-C1]WMC92330.1 HNH endonuclease domain-containing protein [Kineothrix sp. MB12-C1]
MINNWLDTFIDVERNPLMAGYDLKEESYIQKQLTEDDLWSIFSGMFSSKVSHDTSYKYGFFKSILDSLYNADENLVLTFDQLFYKFTEIYWNLVLKYNLRQKAKTKDGRETSLERVLKEALNKQEIIADVSFEAISDEMKIKISHKVKMKCKENVVGALFGDSKHTLYSFSKKSEYIQLNPLVYAFMTKHKIILEKMNYFEWAKYLEKVNEKSSTRNLLNNLDTITFRSDLSVYRRILFEEFEERSCFYCGKELKYGDIHVDHFIPWSFIKDDSLWNLVLSCPQCNRKKSDKLTPELFVNHLIKRNHIILEKDADQISKSYQDQKLRLIYYWAKCNGYHEIWTPGRKVRTLEKIQ